MFYNNLKNFLKRQFPKLVKKLIIIRDSSKLMQNIEFFNIIYI